MNFSSKALLLLTLLVFSTSWAKNRDHFREIRLSLMPSIATSQENNFSSDNNYFQMGAAISYYFLPQLALIAPYSYSKRDDITIHRAGIGPQFSLNCFKNNFHFDLQSAFQYNKIAGNDEFGIQLGGSLGLKLDRRKTFSIGPFYSYHQTFLSGDDYKVHSFGLALHFRNYSDAHMF